MYSQPARYAAPTLGPRVCKRWGSTKSTPRKGRKGYLYGTTPTHPAPSPEEELRITRRRISKAERDERMDITIALTPVKTYMGGFTRPRDLRSSNWFPGGRYATLGKVYESPPESAYEPHTVYLLESRYPVKHGLGRVDCYDHVVGVCREGDFEAILRRYNSARAPRTELDAMDNARWPWGPQFKLQRTKWWGPGENPRDIIKEIFGEEGLLDSAYLDDTGRFEELKEDVEVDTDDSRQIRANVEDEKSNPNPQSVESSTLVASVASAPSSPNTFDTTALSNPPTGKAADSRQGSAIDKGLVEHLSNSDEVTATTMRRPEGKVPHEHSDEDGVLSHASGYVIPTPGEAPNLMSERRSRHHDKQTAAVAERVQQEGDYTDIDAHTRLRANKVPYEALERDGSVSHLSGFVPPTPEHQFGYSVGSSVDNHVQDAVQRQKRRTTAVILSEEMSERQRESDTIIGRDEGDAELNAGLDKAGGKFTDNQKRGIHTSAVVRASEVTHQPVEEDGMDDIDDLDDIDDYEVQRSIPPHIGGSLTKTKFPKHGKAPKARQASLVFNPPAPIPSETQAIRDKYLPTLAETPFWRPLLSLTLSTRPLALTLARLSRALPRGLPFYSSICNDDRKTHASYSARIQCMRIDRMEELTVQIAQLLAGARGGFIGIRFGIQEKGRGIGGEGLEAPLPKEKRTIKVGVGKWYRRAEEVKEAFREDAITRVGEVGVGLEDIGETFEISGLDDHGRRIDDKTGEVIPWPKSKPLETSEFTKEYRLHMKQLDSRTSRSVDDDTNMDIVQVWRNENEMRRARKLKRQELARSYKYEIASQLAQRHRSVTTP
ncbi:hypothetical protein PILCRDRAFT_814444 [Piloderma croceum F 1598]|uniref:Uncharacterized protein n=1 Tax=Piloderma croceum (strain F 1598) TaxID=765440 RepID=A0A0C3CDF4_PILCF|nr:hypothetical protein PILCRDRAFT_814444 [Piloderma croceum F 1598]